MPEEILNIELCEDCKTERTTDGEWVMDAFMCYFQKEYCLNCCGCEEHDGAPWYEPEEK